MKTKPLALPAYSLNATKGGGGTSKGKRRLGREAAGREGGPMERVEGQGR